MAETMERENNGTPVLLGSKIKSVHTINSMYANGYVAVFGSNDEEYRINVSEIMKLLKPRQFLLEKKRVYSHLVLPDYEDLKTA